MDRDWRLNDFFEPSLSLKFDSNTCAHALMPFQKTFIVNLPVTCAFICRLISMLGSAHILFRAHRNPLAFLR